MHAVLVSFSVGGPEYLAVSRRKDSFGLTFQSLQPVVSCIRGSHIMAGSMTKENASPHRALKQREGEEGVGTGVHPLRPCFQ